MTEIQEFLYHIIVILIMMTLMSYLSQIIIMYHIKQIGFELTTEKQKGIKWLISSIVTILTGYFCLLYYLLLR